MIKGLGHLIRTMFGAKRPAPALPSFMVGAVEGDLVAVPPASDDVLRRAMEAASEVAENARSNSHRSVQLIGAGDGEPHELPTLFLHGKAREAEPLTSVEDVMAFPAPEPDEPCDVPRLETLLTFQEIIENAPLASQDVLEHALALDLPTEVSMAAEPIVAEIAEMFAGTSGMQDLTVAELALEQVSEVAAEAEAASAPIAEPPHEAEVEQDWVTIYDPPVLEAVHEEVLVTIVDASAQSNEVAEVQPVAEQSVAEPAAQDVEAIQEEPSTLVEEPAVEATLSTEVSAEPEMQIAGEPVTEQIEEQPVSAKKPAKRKSPAKKKDAPATKRKKASKAFPEDAVFLTDAVIWSQCGSWREFWLPPTDANSSQRVEEFRTLAAAGSFTIWGLPGEGPVCEGNEWTAITPAHWKKAGFDPLAFLAGRENAFSQAPAPKSKSKKPAEPAKYRSLMVSKAAIEELFGAAEQATAAVA